jgi:glycosyltransferase involved in cell wall biosynthesis
MNVSPISILTSPPRSWSYGRLLSYIRHPGIILRQLFISNFCFLGGHFGVTRSLIKGMRECSINFNYNPSISNIHKTCIVLSGIDTLNYVINQKKQGKVKKIIAGPNVVTVPDEAEGLIACKEIDFCIVPSAWVKALYLKISPELANRIVIWPAGVDVNKWKPDSSKKTSKILRDTILIYIKGHENISLGLAYARKLQLMGLKHASIIYGQYSASEYKKLLNRSRLMIVFGGTESQGIALAEAWSMDVPTWVQFKSDWKAPNGVSYFAESAPYLSESTGSYFKNRIALNNLLNDLADIEFNYSPRAWVLDHMTDKISTHELIMKLINNKLEE